MVIMYEEKLKTLSQRLNVHTDELKILLGLPTSSALATANTFDEARKVYDCAPFNSELEAAALKKMTKMGKMLLKNATFDEANALYDKTPEEGSEIGLLALRIMAETAVSEKEVEVVCKKTKGLFRNADDLYCYSDIGRTLIANDLRRANTFSEIKAVYNKAMVGGRIMKLSLIKMSAVGTKLLHTATFDTAKALYFQAPAGSEVKRMALVKMLRLI